MGTNEQPTRAERSINMKTYYFPNSEHEEAFFGSDYPVCVDVEELRRLARGWDLTWEEMMEQVHEASKDEIEEYGTYDAE